MTHEELTQVAMTCLTKAFKGEGDVLPAHVVQAAVSIVLTLRDVPKDQRG